MNAVLPPSLDMPTLWYPSTAILPPPRCQHFLPSDAPRERDKLLLLLWMAGTFNNVVFSLLPAFKSHVPGCFPIQYSTNMNLPFNSHTPRLNERRVLRGHSSLGGKRRTRSTYPQVTDS